MSYVPWMSGCPDLLLLKAETTEREVRSVACQLKVARFLAYRDLADFDFASSEINEALVRQLHRCDFTDVADNVVLDGGPGTGETYIAMALERSGYRASPQSRPLLR